MFRPYASIESPDSIVIGCGLGKNDAGTAGVAMGVGQRCFADHRRRCPEPVVTGSGAGRVPRRPQCHDGAHTTPLEAARLLETSADAIQADRIVRTRELATRYRSLVVLKGAGTISVHTNGRCAINPTGGPALATAGTGDVLAGLLGGLLAQHFDPWQATLAATWLHGRAGEGRDVGLVAGDIAKRAADELAKLRAAVAAD